MLGLETHFKSSSEVNQWIDDRQITIKTFQGTHQGNVNLGAVMQFLKAEWHADLVDVSAGPTLTSLMINAKLMDECRYTTSGLVVGRGDAANERPQSYPEKYNQYEVDKSPVLEVIGIRLFGPFHVYHRGKWMYRH
jgi:riboflavin biosynthesis pyrimidine reductase